MLVRLLNYGFYFLLIPVFILAAGPFDKILILFAFLLSFLISYISFFLKWLTLDGMKAATIIGTVTLGLGGWEFTLYLLIFFMSSNFIGSVLDAPENPKELKLSERRTHEQVWANGFWFILLIIFFFIYNSSTFAVAAISAIAVATSDTWATLIGGYSHQKQVRLITTFQKVPSGTDGGISFNGTISGLLGAILIGILTLFFEHSNPLIFSISVITGGFVGCLIDSYFGAHFQFNRKPLEFFHKRIHVGNNLVNWFSSATGALIGIIIYNTLLYAMV